MSDENGPERVSRFREHTNTNSSIRPPPDELWKDLGLEVLIDKFNDENDNTPPVKRDTHPRHIMERPTTSIAERRIAQPRANTAAARKGSDAAATVATAEGTFGRFSRVFASVFGGVLGKRKAGHADAEPLADEDAQQTLLDERKRAAEEAYHLAKAQGLLPAPKVFVRPGLAPRAWSAGTSASASSRASIRIVEADDARLHNHTHTHKPHGFSYARSHSYPVAAPSAPASHPAHPGKRRKIAQQGRPDQAAQAQPPRQQPGGQARQCEKGTRKRAWE